MCDSTASQSFFCADCHSRLSYCCAPVADFHPGFFCSFHMDCAKSAEATLTTINTIKKELRFMRESVAARHKKLPAPLTWARTLALHGFLKCNKMLHKRKWSGSDIFMKSLS